MRITGLDMLDAADDVAHVTVPAPLARLAPTARGEVLAGVACADLTPAPGMPMAGHSRNARTAVGVRHRVSANVIHLSAGDENIVVIGCDLLAGSALVHRLVAEQVAGQYDVAARGILFTATHTHAGPGQYSSSEFYNRWASNKPGFDPDYTAFIVRQISAAVGVAIDTRRPATIAVGSTEVWGLTRNRSLRAFLRTVEPQSHTGTTEFDAINPTMQLLRVDDEDGPIGAFTWFSIHGTAVTSACNVLHGDVWRYLCDELRRRIAVDGRPQPVCGGAVATHGDIAPAVRRGQRSFAEAERLGRALGVEAARLHESLADSLSSTVRITAGIRDLPLLDADGAHRGIPTPRIGFPKLAGAFENTTRGIAAIPPFRWGSRWPTAHGPQGVKIIVGFTDAAHDRLAGRPTDFPTVLPIQLIEIDDVVIVGVPFETTVSAGRVVAAAVPRGREVIISSLSTDHCDYLTTPAEYAVQRYEGASTLFGPGQAAFLADAVAALHADMTGGTPVQDLLDRAAHLRVRRFASHRDRRSPRREIVVRPRFVRGENALDGQWWEVVVRAIGVDHLRWHEPLARIEIQGPDGWTTYVDDTGCDISVELLRRRLLPARIRVRWHNPPHNPGGRYRFVLAANGGFDELTSEEFPAR